MFPSFSFVPFALDNLAAVREHAQHGLEAVRVAKPYEGSGNTVVGLIVRFVEGGTITTTTLAHLPLLPLSRAPPTPPKWLY
jgi:hypothetical protein